MYSNIFTPIEDLWLFNSTGSSFTYSLITSPTNIKNMVKVLRIADFNNQVHFFIPDDFEEASHVIWDNHKWQKNALPFNRWDNLLTFVDSSNNLYILVKNSLGFHLSIWDLGYTSLGLSIKNFNLEPLYFTVDNSYIYLYLTDSDKCTMVVYILSRETGSLQSYYALIDGYDYYIHNHWVFEDLMILVLQDGLTDKKIKLMVIDLDTKECKQKQYDYLNLNKNTTYHLLVDKNNLLLLASCYHYFYHTVSFNRGKLWTNPQESILFSPVVFSDITSVNNSPTALISLKQIKGHALQYPIILTLTEISSVLCNNKVIYKDSVFKPRKL